LLPTGEDVLVNLADPRIRALIDDPGSGLYEIIRRADPQLVSFHILFSAENTTKDNVNRCIPVPGARILERQELLETIVSSALTLKNTLEAKGFTGRFLLESVDYQTGGAYEYITEPSFIREVLRRTGAMYLLDCSHLFIAARNLPEYADQFYMNYVMELVNGDNIAMVGEMHVAVPSYDADGERWTDQHMPFTYEGKYSGKPHIEKIMKYVLELREKAELTDPLPLVFETGRQNFDDDITDLARVLGAGDGESEGARTRQVPAMTFDGPVSTEALPGGELIEQLRASITQRSVDKEACDRLASMGYQIATVKVEDGYGNLDGIHELMTRMFDMETAIRVQTAMSEAIFNILNYAVDKYGGAGALLAAEIDGMFILTIIDKGAGFDSDQDYSRVEGGTRRGYGLQSFRMMSTYFKHIARPDGNTIVIARKGNKPGDSGQEAPGKGSVSEGLKELYTNFSNAQVRVKEFAAARGYSETTVRMELKMLEELGLVEVDRSQRAYWYGLDERVRDLAPDIIDRICSLVEMNRYEIPADRLDVLRGEINSLMLDHIARNRTAPLAEKYKTTSEKQRRILNRGEKTYSEAFERDLIPSHERLSAEMKKRGEIAAIFTGVVGSASSGKTTIVNGLREAYEKSDVAGGARVIFFDDWLRQKSDREIDPETGRSTEDVLKKFKVTEFVRAMKTFIAGKGATGTELVKPVYDAEAKGQIKFSIDAAGKVVIFNGDSVRATVERGENGELVIVVSERGKEVSRGRSVRVGSIPVSIDKGTSEAGEIEVNIRGTVHRFSAYEGEQRQVVVLDGKGERAPPMVDHETGDLLAETDGVLTAEGDKWEAKEFISYKDGVYIVEGILALYDYDGVPKGERLSDLYDDTVFVDCDFDIRLERGILRERRRTFLEKGRDATDEEIMGYVEKFMARKGTEDTFIYPAKRGVSYRVTTQTRLESLYVLYKIGRLLHPSTLSVLEEMDLSPYYIEEQLDASGHEYLKERLSAFKGTLMQSDEEGVSFFVLRIGNGLVVKVPHDQESFDRGTRPFYDRLVSKVGGGLVAPGEIINVSDLDIKCKVDGETRRLENVLVQTEVTPLRERLAGLMEDGETARAKDILREFFVLQQKLWRVGLIDADPVMDRYGLTIEDGRERMVMFTVNSLTNDPGAYYVSNYRKNFGESVPAELRDYAVSLVDKYIPPKAEFRRKYFEKHFSGASSMAGVAHPELVGRRLDYLAREVLRVKSDFLRGLFDGEETDDASRVAVWTKMWIETISFPGSPTHESLSRFYETLLKEGDIVSRSPREELREKIISGMAILDLRALEEVDVFLSHLYGITEEAGEEAKDERGAHIAGVPAGIGGRGSVGDGLKELYSNFRNTPVSVRDFAAARRYSETTVRMELKMLEELGLITADISGRPYMFLLKGYVRQLSPEVIDRICAIPEMDRYEIKSWRIRFVKREIDGIVRDADSKVRYAAEITEGSALILVHAGRDLPPDPEHGDADCVIEETAREMAGSGVFDEIYEIAAADYPFYDGRPIGHNGHVMVQPDEYLSPRANERVSKRYRRSGARAARVQDHPADYSFRDLKGNDFTIIGGGFDYCHRLAFGQLVDEVAEGLRQSGDRQTGPVRITIPSDAVYKNYEETHDGEQYFSSMIPSITPGQLSGYIAMLRRTGMPFSVVRSVRGREKVIESSGDAPAIILRIAATSEEVIKELETGRKQKEGVGTEDKDLIDRLNAEMERIHEMDIELIPPLEDGKILWHVIPAELIPLPIRKDFIKMVSDLNRDLPEMREKIRIVTEKQDVAAATAELAADVNNIVDVAVVGEGQLESLPEGVKALVFEGELGDFRQLEGILAALRALQQNNARALMDLHKILTGEDYDGDEASILKNIADPVALSKVIKYTLLPIRVYDHNALDDMNQRLLQLIRAA